MRLFLVDDDPLVLDSLEILLGSADHLEVAGKALGGPQALAQLARTKVDLVLMDLQMPGMDGVETTRRLKTLHPGLPVIMLTTFHDFRHVHRSLQAGAQGYILKSDPLEVQVKTIQAVHQGLPVISDTALRALSQPLATDLLTAREGEVLEQLAHGLSNKEIAQRVFMSEGTVRNHISVILEKLQLRDRTQLAIWYWQHLGTREGSVEP